MAEVHENDGTAPNTPAIPGSGRDRYCCGRLWFTPAYRAHDRSSCKRDRRTTVACPGRWFASCEWHDIPSGYDEHESYDDLHNESPSHCCRSNHYPSDNCPNNGACNHHTANNQPASHQSANHHAANHYCSDSCSDSCPGNRRSNHHTTNNRGSNHHTTNNRTSNDRGSNHHTTNNRTSNDRGSDHHTPNQQPSDHDTALGCRIDDRAQIRLGGAGPDCQPAVTAFRANEPPHRAPLR